MLVWDAETEGFDPTLPIHCIVIYDRSDGSITRFREGAINSLAAGVNRIMSHPNICHNQLKFDQACLKHHFSWFVPHPQSFDTLVMSRMLFPEKGFKHGLEEWGERVGIAKPEIDDWQNLSIEEYLHRCEEDVKINNLVFDELMKRAREVGGDWRAAFKLEHEATIVHRKQVDRGCYLDKDLCLDNIRVLEKFRATVDEKVSPELPIIREVDEGKWPVSEREEKGVYKFIETPFTQTGKLKKFFAQHWEGQEELVGGPHTRISYRRARTNEREPIIKFLLDSGWKPAQWNFKKDKDGNIEKDAYGKAIVTSPKLSKDDPFNGVTTRAGKLIGLRFTAGYRIGDCNRFLKHLREDGTVPTEAIVQGTPTARYAHKIVNTCVL